MKCNNLVEGELCGAENPLLTKFCACCGGKFQIEEDITAKPCPYCSSLVTKREKFCTVCGWKIDPNMFVTKTIVCGGTKEGGTTCGAELQPHMKFCVTCGTVQNKASDHAEGPKDTILHPVSESSVDGFVKDEQPRHYTHVSEGSSSGSSSYSQSTWKLPSTWSGSSPDSTNRESSKSNDEALLMETFGQGQQLHHGNNGVLEEKADQSNSSKADEVEKQYNARSKTQTTDKDDRQPTETVPKAITACAMESNNSIPEEAEKQYTTRSTTQTTDKDGKLNQNAFKTGSNPSANKSSEEDKSARRKNTGGRKSVFDEVYFHIIVSPTLLSSLNKGEVFVHFQSPTLAGWHSRRHKMNLKRNLPEDFMEYQAVVKIPKDMLVKPVYYAYYVIRNGDELVDEYIYNHAFETNYRTLMYTEQNRKRDLVHQYDGIVKEKPEKDKNKGFIETIKGLKHGNDFTKHMKAEAAFSFRHFVSHMQLTISDTSGMCGEDIIQHIDSIFYGLKATYACLWYSSRDYYAYLSKELHDYLSEVLTKLYERKKSPVDVEDQILHLSAAVAMMYLKDLYDVDLTNVEMERLCASLLPFLDKEKRQCPDFEGLILYFPKIKKRIFDSLLKMVKTLAIYSTQTCWFYCIPLLHFLLGKYKPYQAATAKANHDERIPEWWGIAEFTQELAYFQGKIKWDKSREKVLQAISPYFAVDFLLPRTYVASLSFYHLSNKIDLEILPTDAVLGAICYFIKISTSRRLFGEKFQNMKKLLEKVSSLLLKLSADEKWALETPCRNYKIAGNVLDNLYTTYGDEKCTMCLSAAETLFISIDWFAKCMAIRQSEGAKGTYSDHLTCYEHHRERVKNVLINEQCNGHEEDFLKKWNIALSLKIPEGDIRDSWIHFLKGTLESALERRTRGTEVKLIEIYCENVESFCDAMQEILSKLAYKANEDDPDCTSAGMIQACLSGDKSISESRYLLLLTENYGALTILQQEIFTMDNAVVIFGSSFPSDQEYTQVCRNINRIKVCMETGSTVILLNLENMYESLYDALNQYYVKFGGERYVDLGLDKHRVLCRVHKKFRLIVVAEKQIVYSKFPILLVNRLEKHFLSLKTMLTPGQIELTEKLQKWAQDFCEDKITDYLIKKRGKRKIGDVFMGYHDDVCAAIILHVCQEQRCDQAISRIEREICQKAQSILLWCATPAAVWQLDNQEVFHTYFTEQHHDSLADYLHYKMVTEQKGSIHAQITTNSKLLSTADIDILCRSIPIQRQNVTLLTLQSFDTEQKFCRQIKPCFNQSNTSNMLLIVQCDHGDQNADLIACARYTVQGEVQQVQQDRATDIHMVFLIQLSDIAGGCFTGFQCGLWHSVHIDDLHPSPEEIPSVAEMHAKSVSALQSSTEERLRKP